jgi:hypothetical protein
VRLGARCSEERRLPGPVRRVDLTRWGGVPAAPKSFRFPVPVELAGRPSEECRLPGPGGAVSPVLRRARGLLPPRCDAQCSEERRLSCPVGSGSCPYRSGYSLAGWNRVARAPKSSGFPVLLAGSPYPEGRGTGVRGRGFNAVMLRSAEADPHVTEHSLAAVAEASMTAV